MNQFIKSNNKSYGDMQTNPTYTLTLDIGSTNIRSHIYDKSLKLKGIYSEKVNSNKID